MPRYPQQPYAPPPGSHYGGPTVYESGQAPAPDWKAKLAEAMESTAYPKSSMDLATLAMPAKMPPGMFSAMRTGANVAPPALKALKALTPSTGGRVTQAGGELGGHLADFTPVGGEGAFNAGRVGGNIANNPAINQASEHAFNTYAGQAGNKTFVKPSAMPAPPVDLPPVVRPMHTPPIPQAKVSPQAAVDLAGQLKSNLSRVPQGTRMSSEAGMLDVTPEQMIMGGAGAGIAAYGAPQAYKALRDLGSNLNQRFNPFQQYSNALDPKAK